MLTGLNLALAACGWLGHAFALTVLLNVVYAQPLPRRMLRGGRLLVAVGVFAFPFVVAGWHDNPGVRGYVVLSAVIGGGVLPCLTAYRALRRPPAALVAGGGRVVDIAKSLGRRPSGFGEHWRLARLPGNQLFEVEFTERTLCLPQIPPAWEGLTILHVTDLHFHGTPTREFFERTFDLALAAGEPDLLCLTGDFVDTVRHQRWIKPLVGRLKFREAGLAILGNHDLWNAPAGVRRQLARTGLRVLGNQWAGLTIRGEPMVAVGNEAPWFRPRPELRDAPSDVFRLCLSHTPDNLPWAAANGIDLMLSGHVHGGQVRVPVLGPLFMPSRFSRRYDGGAFRHGNTLLYVSRGLSGREPLRWNCRPEVTRITLVSGRAG